MVVDMQTSPAKPAVFCLLGPTASGKTPLAIELVKRLPCEIISVDSAMVYRGMDIGTAKPDEASLKTAPHRLIDIADPKEIYSAGHFREDALREIKDIIAAGKIPLLVGGTMLYFRVLQQGLAPLPKANQAMRATLQIRAEQVGWETLHKELMEVDPLAAARIHERDSQRIQRALEVYLLTGKTITDWQKETSILSEFDFYHLALIPTDREKLQQKIAERFHQMLDLGFIDEVKRLYERYDLSPDLPSIRSVGYRQAWAYLSGLITYDEMVNEAIIATRQLAKRQLTWLRSWPALISFASEENNVLDQVVTSIKTTLSKV